MMRRTRALTICCLVAALVWLTGCVEGIPSPEPPGAPPVVRQAATPVDASPFFEGEPGAGMEVINFPAQNDKSSGAWGPVMTDVIQHLPLSYGNTYYDADKITYTHETTHGINSHIRNTLNNTGQRANGFYIPGDRAVVVVEPRIRKSAVAPYVPAGLRGSRFDLYILGSSSWDDTPLYVFDEWIAYINGGQAGVELAQLGLWDAGWRDGVAGQLEFTVYALALAMAVRDGDPQYFESNTQFREVLAFNVRRAMEVYRVGAGLSQFTWGTQDAYYERLKTSPEAEPIRAFARELFGASWANAVLLGDGSLPPGDVLDDPQDPQQGDPNNPQDPQQPGPQDPQDPPPADPQPQQPDDLNRPPVDDDPDFNQPPPSGPILDDDRDGIPDEMDLCGKTRLGAQVWLVGEWIGCAGGQYRDRLPPAKGADADRDGIEDSTDQCSNSPRPSLVWAYGEWMGCAEGQRRDGHRNNPDFQGPDADGDGIPDNLDLCAGSPPGAAVWSEGEWMGCAEGQLRN